MSFKEDNQRFLEQLRNARAKAVKGDADGEVWSSMDRMKLEYSDLLVTSLWQIHSDLDSLVVAYRELVSLQKKKNQPIPDAVAAQDAQGRYYKGGTK